MSASYDAVVVGAGHNGLVAAVLLAREGWSVLVVERADRIGGAVASAEITRPGSVSDVFSTNQNQFRFGPVHAPLGADLES
jgi:phytoene dehydrogenase-like protein